MIDKIADWDNLLEAYRLARRGKRNRGEVIDFELNLFDRLAQIQLELLSGEYKPGRRRHFVVFEPQRREIYASPFRDRVVQHAIFLVCGNEMDRAMIDDTFACRKGKGTHRAASRAQKMISGMERQGVAWYLKTDLKKYFASISHALAKSVIRKRIRCQFTLKVLDDLIDTMMPGYEKGMGLTIGDLANQWIANLVGNEFDQIIKRELRIKRYVRYMDDMLMVFSSRAEAVYYLGAIDRLVRSYGFSFSGWSIQPAYRGVDFVGYRIWSTHRLLRKDSVRRMRRRVKRMRRRYESGVLDRRKAIAQIRSWIAHARHANTDNLILNITGEPAQDGRKIINQGKNKHRR